MALDNDSEMVIRLIFSLKCRPKEWFFKEVSKARISLELSRLDEL